MERIGFDARMAGYTGIGTYIKNLLAEYAGLGFLKFVSVYGFPRDDGLKKICGGRVIKVRAPVYSLSEQFYPGFMGRKSGRIFHSPHYNAPLLFRGKLIVTIHDLTHLKKPEYLPSGKAGVYARVMLSAVSRKAARIITSSESVKSDIIRLLKTPGEKITVIPLAAGREFSPDKESDRTGEFREKYGLPGKFVLYVGNMKKHKNLGILLEAFRNFRRKNGAGASLVISTAGRINRETVEKASILGLSGAVKFLPFIPDREMPLLYNTAHAFVFPSVSEGFGLPVLEAMACGVPCAVSNASSLPEVAGGAALLCDPASASDFEKALLDLFSDSSLRESLSARGLERAARFSWEKTAGETINLYNECCGGMR